MKNWNFKNGYTLMSKALKGTPRGYTLIELLVVISIMGVVGLGIYTSSRSFAQDQVLNKAVGDIQSFIRLAQSNAATAKKCGNVPSTDWIVEFSNETTINLFCKISSTTSPVLQKTLNLERGAKIQGTMGEDSSGNPSCVVNSPAAITFASVYGTAKFNFSTESCLAASKKLLITVLDPDTTKTTIISVTKGGSVGNE